MRLSPLEERISRIIEPVITDLGFELYCVQQAGGDEHGMIIQVMAENPKTKVLGVEECTAISRAVGAVMDVEAPLRGASRLADRSTGIATNSTTLEHYEVYIGI